MARSFQRFFAVGNVGKDPEIRVTHGGRRVAQFALCTSRMWRDEATGQTREKKEWHRCVAWNPEPGRGVMLADVIERSVKKGDQLAIEGRVEYRSYKERGGTKDIWVTEIVVTDMVMTSGPDTDEGEVSDE